MENGNVFGPADLPTLQAWARDGRLAPANEISEDGRTWQPITRLAELEMDWVAEVTAGTFYGPIHRGAVAELVRDGSLPAEAPLFHRQRGAAEPPTGPSPRDQEWERRLSEQQQAAAQRLAETEQALRTLRNELDQAHGAVAARDLEFEAERQEHKAAVSRVQAELVKREAHTASLEKEAARLAQVDRDRSAEAARLAALERQVADAAGVRSSLEQQLEQARVALRDAQQSLAPLRESAAQSQQQLAAAQTQLRTLQLRQESVRKLLQQAAAAAAFEEEPPRSATIDVVPVESGQPPPRAGVSLANLEAQAQRELRQMGAKGQPPWQRK